MKNFVNAGGTMPYTNGGGATITSGSVVVIAAMLAVATVDIAPGETGTVATEGVFDLPKVNAAVIGQGQTLTWDISAGAFDDDQATPATGDITGACAIAWETKGVTTDGTIRVKLTGAPGTVKTA